MSAPSSSTRPRLRVGFDVVAQRDEGIHFMEREGSLASMPKPSPTRYRTTNWSTYNASLRKRDSLAVWFDPDMVWHAETSGKRGRSETFSDAAIQTCLTLQGEGRPGNRPVACFSPERAEPRDVRSPVAPEVGLARSLIRMAGLDWPVPFVGRSFHWKAR